MIELLDLLTAHPDCYFQVFTNGQFITEKVAARLAEIGNATPLVSIEGREITSNVRRGNKDVLNRTLRGLDNCLKAGLLNKGRAQNAVELDALQKKEQLDRNFINFFGRALNQGNPVYGPLIKLQGISSSNYDAELKDIEKSGRYNPLVVQALVKAAPRRPSVAKSAA